MCLPCGPASPDRAACRAAGERDFGVRFVGERDDVLVPGTPFAAVPSAAPFARPDPAPGEEPLPPALNASGVIAVVTGCGRLVSSGALRGTTPRRGAGLPGLDAALPCRPQALSAEPTKRLGQPKGAELAEYRPAVPGRLTFEAKPVNFTSGVKSPFGFVLAARALLLRGARWPNSMCSLSGATLNNLAWRK